VVATVPGHVRAITQLALTPDGKTLSTYSGDHIARWDLTTGKELRRFRRDAYPGQALLSSQGNAVAGWWNVPGYIHVWDLRTGKVVGSVVVPRDKIAVGVSPAVALSGDGKTVAVHHQCKEVLAYDVATGREIAHLKKPRDRFDFPPAPFRPGWQARALFTPGSEAIVTHTFPTRALVFWELGGSPGRLNLGAAQDRHLVSSFTFSRDGRYLALTGEGGTRVVELLTGKLLARIAHSDDPSVRQRRSEFSGFVPSFAALSPDGTFLAAGSKEVRVWDLLTGKEVAKFAGHLDEVTSLLFSPDGKRLISGSADTTALIWDIEELLRREKARGAWAARAREDLWAALAGEPMPAAKAMSRLTGDPKQAVALLAEKLRPTAGPNEKQFRQWVKALGSADFAARQSAAAELEKAGVAALAVLEEALAKKPDLETARSARMIADKIALALPISGPELIRGRRALQLLEQLATPEARALLEAIARGGCNLPLARQANESLARLRRKP